MYLHNCLRKKKNLYVVCFLAQNLGNKQKSTGLGPFMETFITPLIMQAPPIYRRLSWLSTGNRLHSKVNDL